MECGSGTAGVKRLRVRDARVARATSGQDVNHRQLAMSVCPGRLRLELVATSSGKASAAIDADVRDVVFAASDLVSERVSLITDRKPPELHITTAAGSS